jgi:hypothetical protein
MTDAARILACTGAGFNTKLVDHGIGLQAIHDFPGRDATFPQPSPAMAGGLFSVSRR